MKYKWNPFSLVDSPNGSAAVIYSTGCSLKCPYCFNPDLRIENSGDYSFEDIIEKIKGLHSSIKDENGEVRSFNKVEWIIISGGEPLDNELHEIVTLLQVSRNYDFKTGLFTSGYKPNKLNYLYNTVMIDYIHIDFKSIDETFLNAISLSSFRFCNSEILNAINFSVENYKRANSSWLHINTTVLRSIHTPELLLDMKYELLNALGLKEIRVYKKPNFDDRIFWTLTPVSFEHTNTLKPIDFVKDGWFDDDLEYVISILNL